MSGRFFLFSHSRLLRPSHESLLRTYTKYSGHRPRPRGSGHSSSSQVLPSVWRPIAFTLGVSGCAALVAASSTNSDANRQLKRMQDSHAIGSSNMWNRIFQNHGSISFDLARARLTEFRKKMLRRVRSVMLKGSSLWNGVVTFVAESWIPLSEAERTCLGLIAFQGLIFGLWKIPSLQSLMRRHFLSDPFAARLHTSFTSIFSHNSLSHFALNSIAFASIGTSAHTYFFSSQVDSHTGTPTSTARYEFLAFFLGGGLAGNLASQLHTRFVKVPAMLRRGGAANLAAAGILPSLGSSAAVWSCLTVSALAFPAASLSIIFLPFIKLPIGVGVAMAAAVDALGLIRGWRMFDHAAHLGGAAYGLLYYHYGASCFDSVRAMLPSRPKVEDQ